VDADENDSSGEAEEEDEEDEDLLQDMIDQYEHVTRAAPTKPQKAGIKGYVGRTINNTMKPFNTSTTYGTAIAPSLVICGIIFSLDLAYDGGGGGQGGTVNCFFLSTQIEEMYLSEVNTLRQVLESDPNNVELRSLIRRDDIDGVWDMMTKVIDNLTSERSKRGRFYNITLLNETIINYTAIRDAIEAGVVPPSFLWANQAELPFDSSPLVSFEKDSNKMNSQMEMFALHHFNCNNKKLPLRFNPRGALSLASNFERIKKRAEHGAKSEFELFFYDSDYAARFKLYLTEDERNNPNDIPIERKKERCLAFLHGEGYVAKHFTPITLVPSEDFSLNSLNASEEEMKTFWERMIPELFENKERVITELEEREGKVSLFVCLFVVCLILMMNHILYQSHALLDISTLLKLALLPQRLERTQSIVQQNRGVFRFIESMQHTRQLQKNETLDWFSKKLEAFVQDISGLESLTFVKLSDITENEFANVGDKNHRINKLGELTRNLFGYIDGGVEGQCALCDNKLLGRSLRSKMGWHGEHPNDKTADPAQLAIKANSKFVPEVLDPEKGLIHTCDGCNDKGTRRKEELKELKYARK